MFFSKRSSPSLPQAFAVQNSNKFDSYDGSWSTFNLNVGPVGQFQSFRFLPSTSSFSTWLPNAQGCNYTVSDFADPAEVPADIWSCASSRGVGNFDKNQSTGFIDSDPISTDKLTDLGLDLNPTDVFGSDYSSAGGELSLQNLSLSTALASANSELSTNKPVPVFSIVDWDYYLPTLGLGVGDLVLGDASYSSALTSLAADNTIPSRSWGYTAGASYQSAAHDQYPGSLVIGGYDESRLISNSTIQIPMPQGVNTTELRVEVSSVIINYANGSTPRSGGIGFEAVIESTLPYLYLPQTICDMFVDVFNLTGPDSSNLYTLDNSTVAENKANVASIDFVIQDIRNATHTVTIELPYAAFDAMASWTHNYDGPQPIFPIRPTPGDTAILGRAFLQEAYISANYEPDVMKFNISKAAFPASSGGSIIQTIYSTANLALIKSHSHSNNLSGGAIAGIVVGSVIGVLALAFLAWYFIFRRRHSPPPDFAFEMNEKAGANQDQIAELASRPTGQKHLSELGSESERGPGSDIKKVHEMEGAGDVSGVTQDPIELEETPPLGSPEQQESPEPQELEGEGYLLPRFQHEGNGYLLPRFENERDGALPSSLEHETGVQLPPRPEHEEEEEEESTTIEEQVPPRQEHEEEEESTRIEHEREGDSSSNLDHQGESDAPPTLAHQGEGDSPPTTDHQVEGDLPPRLENVRSVYETRTTIVNEVL